MTISFPSDVQQVIDARMATGNYATESDVLREALQALQREDEEVTAIQEAIDDWQAGDDGLTLDDAFREIWQSIREGQSV